ncbi:protein spaetzle-like isoform X2 [Epargyreus clarus]|uniref:protein spaetzle-like isoform X2 n=1 Tax=Epargyreus clarus TaxID=520877 RepID=UPI003C2DDF5B
MAWIYYTFYMLLFQISVRSFGIIEAPKSPRIARSTNAKTNEDIVFPGLTSRFGDDSLQIPDECKAIGLCEYAPKDMDQLVKNIIKDFQRRNKTFISDILPIQISNRLGSDDQNVELCPSRERLYTPKMARDLDNKWYRIVNTDENKVQKFRIEICSKVDAPCSDILFFHEGYEARCVQKYVMRQIVAVERSTGVVDENKYFPLPSCCSCVARVV